MSGNENTENTPSNMEQEEVPHTIDLSTGRRRVTPSTGINTLPVDQMNTLGGVQEIILDLPIPLRIAEARLRHNFKHSGRVTTISYHETHLLVGLYKGDIYLCDLETMRNIRTYFSSFEPIETFIVGKVEDIFFAVSISKIAKYSYSRDMPLVTYQLEEPIQSVLSLRNPCYIVDTDGQFFLFDYNQTHLSLPTAQVVIRDRILTPANLKVGKFKTMTEIQKTGTNERLLLVYYDRSLAIINLEDVNEGRAVIWRQRIDFCRDPTYIDLRVNQDYIYYTTIQCDDNRRDSLIHKIPLNLRNNSDLEKIIIIPDSRIINIFTMDLYLCVILADRKVEIYSTVTDSRILQVNTRYYTSIVHIIGSTLVLGTYEGHVITKQLEVKNRICMSCKTSKQVVKKRTGFVMCKHALPN
jgi:WD40 repeat protein